MQPRISIGFRFRWIAILLSLSAIHSGCGQRNISSKPMEARSPEQTAKIDLMIEQFCGNCHPLPAPSSFSKSHWPSEVERGFSFYLQSGRTDLEVPVVLDAERYFQSRAPERIEIPSAQSFPNFPSAVRFTPSPLLLSGDQISLTADIKWFEPTQSLIFSDMANSKLRTWSLSSDPNFINQPAEELKTLTEKNVVGSGNHLCRIAPCDWNQDNIQDYLVAEIGSMIISDQKLGEVAIYIGTSQNTFDRHSLATGLARPAEAVPFDYDDDGDKDILVAEFGYNTVGCLSLLRNITPPGAIALAPNEFQYEVIDPRHGHLAVTLDDMNNDGKLDIITAVGQEYESVQIRYNLGNGQFRSEIVLALPDPSYNSSSIHICDFNQDNRKDIIHTCGDIFDSFVPKQFHGVRIIENLGQSRWNVQELGMLIGAMQATSADFDLDGDIDIAAVGLFPGSANYSPKTSYDSVVWWEQIAPGEFRRHSIERDRCLHSSCTTADIDADGRPDLVVGEWAEGEVPSSLRIYWNRETK